MAHTRVGDRHLKVLHCIPSSEATRRRCEDLAILIQNARQAAECALDERQKAGCSNLPCEGFHP